MQTTDLKLREAANAGRAGHTEEALRLCDELISACRQHQDVLQTAYVLRHTASIASKLGSFGTAAAQIIEAETIYREQTPARPLDLANALRIGALNQERSLIGIWQEARELYASLNVEAGVVEAELHFKQLVELNPKDNHEC